MGKISERLFAILLLLVIACLMGCQDAAEPMKNREKISAEQVAKEIEAVRQASVELEKSIDEIRIQSRKNLDRLGNQLEEMKRKIRNLEREMNILTPEEKMPPPSGTAVKTHLSPLLKGLILLVLSVFIVFFVRLRFGGHE